MPYENLTDEDFLEFAHTVPNRADWVNLHSDMEQVRKLRWGDDVIAIPETHIKLSRMENHEGSAAFDARITGLANWLTMAKLRLSVMAGSADQELVSQANVQERFGRNAYKMMLRGNGRRNWAFELADDMAMLGMAIVRHAPRAEYYDKMPVEDPGRSDFLRGTKITDLISSARVDPQFYADIEGPDGTSVFTTVGSKRLMGDIARRFGMDKARQILGYHDIGTDQPRDSQPGATEFTPGITTRPADPKYEIETVECWSGDRGMLIVTSGSRTNMSADSADRILDRWTNPWGKPPYYIRTILGKTPLLVPLEQMRRLTSARNFYATMVDLQAAGAAFRHWQLVDTNKQEVFDLNTMPDRPPENVIFDLSKPPPYMGPNMEWRLAPFEFNDLMPRYQEIVLQHEAAASAVQSIMGGGIGENTAVATASIMEHQTRRAFSNIFETIEESTEREWTDIFRWLRDVHKDEVFVHAKQADPVGQRFLNVALSLTSEDIVSLDVRAHIRPDLPIDQAARYRLGREMRNARDISHATRVENDLIPFVDDFELEQQMVLGEDLDRLESDAVLQAQVQETMQLLGIGMQQKADQGSLTDSAEFDKRGTGTESGPGNISDTGLAEGASDTIGPNSPLMITAG